MHIFSGSRVRSIRRRSMNGLQLAPAALVPSIRALFETQGIGGNAVDDQGNIDPQALLALAFDQVEIRTNATPPVTMSLKGPSDPATQAILAKLNPTLIFTGAAGRAVLAPYDGTSGGDWFGSLGGQIAMGVVAGATGIAILAILFGKKS